MKIIHLLYSDKFSGAENVACQIIGMFSGDENIEMVYCSSDGPVKDVLAEKGVRYIPLKKFTVKEIRRVIREEKADVVYAHDMRASFYAYRACGKLPFISHIHNNAFDSRGLSLKSIAYYFAARKARHIFWVSKSAFNGYFFHNRFKNKSSVLYNVIDVDGLLEKMKTDENVYDYDVVYVGRLTFAKDPPRLMRVIKLLAEKMPSVKVAVVGTGELEEETKKLAREYGIENNVDFLGFTLNPYKILHDGKVMVMTSKFEGTPMCALEAMALGVPIVSTPTDGLKDLVDDGVTGFLSDKDEELVARIHEVIENAEQRKILSENSSKKARVINDREHYKNEILRVLPENDESGK